MKHKTYMALLSEAKKYNDMREWVAAYGYPADCPYEPNELITVLQIIFQAAHEDIKSLQKYDKNLSCFSRRFDINYSSAVRWSKDLIKPQSAALVYLIGYALIGDVPTCTPPENYEE